MTTQTKLSLEAQKVSDFLVKMGKDLLNEQGIRVGMSDLGVFTAAKKVTPKECIKILQTTFNRLVAEHPEVAELLLQGATDKVKDSLRRACGMKEQDTTKE